MNTREEKIPGESAIDLIIAGKTRKEILATLGVSNYQLNRQLRTLRWLTPVPREVSEIRRNAAKVLENIKRYKSWRKALNELFIEQQIQLDQLKQEQVQALVDLRAAYFRNITEFDELWHPGPIRLSNDVTIK